MNRPEVRDAIRADLLCAISDIGELRLDSREITTERIGEVLREGGWSNLSNRSVAAYLNRLHEEDLLWRPGRGGWWLRMTGHAVVRMLRAKADSPPVRPATPRTGAA